MIDVEGRGTRARNGGTVVAEPNEEVYGRVFGLPSIFKRMLKSVLPFSLSAIFRKLSERYTKREGMGPQFLSPSSQLETYSPVASLIPSLPRGCLVTPCASRIGRSRTDHGGAVRVREVGYP